ncbi:MAG: aminotransferase class V-fold PLP-dependent enzyme, partial [Longimicrobiales bacterium]
PTDLAHWPHVHRPWLRGGRPFQGGLASSTVMNSPATLATDRLAGAPQRELSRLSGEVYLDYTGAALYPAVLLEQHFETLRDGLFGNPHSTHPASVSSTRCAQEARAALLEFLDADPDEYDVVWTTNASGAIQLVAESFPFGPDTRFVLTADNHNAVNGVREFARARGAPVTYLPLEADLRVSPFDLSPVRQGLFAYPAQSNFSGVQHPLEWVERAQARGYRVLLDAAAFVPTHPLSLRTFSPDFVTLSLYKICGYPTGVGALVGKREALSALTRPAFSGGTVEFVSVLADRSLLKSGSAGFEHGTGNFLAWSAVPPGLQWIRCLDRGAVQAHVAALTARALQGLLGIRHDHGMPAVRIHGPTETHARGGAIAFNVLDATDTVIDFEHVVDAAAAQGICLRGGCFCNPGAAERAFNYGADELAKALDAVRHNFSMPAMRAALNHKPVGAVRVSVGYGSQASDIDTLLAFLRTFIHNR